MNDRSSPLPAAAAGAPPPEPADLALPRGLRLGPFEIERVLNRSASTIVYLATDHGLAMPVALQEYLPARLARRDAGLHLRAAEPWHEDTLARGRRAFIDEARMLARCDHPSLVRVTQLFEALGSAYRAMPVYTGQRLVDMRRERVGAPDEDAIRRLLTDLLDAIETIHRSGRSHGGVSPTNILLLADDRPLLLGPGTAAREIGTDLVDSLMATIDPGSATAADSDAGAPPVGAALDLYALADTVRFCLTGEAVALPGTLQQRKPLADVIADQHPPETRPQYSPALLGTLDAALSTFAEDRPLTAAQFRDWLERGAPGGSIRVAPAPPPAVQPRAAPEPTEPLAPWPEPAATFTDDLDDPDSPIAPWPGLSAALTDDPITPDRPPWVPPPLPPQLQRAATHRARVHKMLMAAGLAAVVVGGLATAAIWWRAVPEIQLEPAGQTAITPVDAARERGPEPQQQPPPEATIEPAGAIPPPVAPVASAPVAPAAAADPARAIATHPPGAGPNSSARPVTGAAVVPGGNPRAACASRTEFALYRCMQLQCQSKRWATHAQCVTLRLDDRVD